MWPVMVVFNPMVIVFLARQGDVPRIVIYANLVDTVMD
jgi:hypothetical protein